MPGLDRTRGGGRHPDTSFIPSPGGEGESPRATVTSGQSVSGAAHSQTAPPPSGTPELNISEADGHPAGELKGPGTGAN